MRLTPLPLDVGEEDGFANDIFGYKGFGERFANLVCNINEPLVIALDGAWGSGKTTFIKQWAGLLRRRIPSVPVIYFDAFTNDVHDDAFMVLAGEIVSFAKSRNDNAGNKIATLTEKATAVGKAILPAATKIGLRALTIGALSANDLESISGGIKEIISATSEDLGTLLEKQIEDQIENAAKEKEKISSFKNALEDLALQLRSTHNKDQNNTPPLVIIIDELDRCRPSFAINMLERVKHLFSVPGVCFVFVTYFPQIEASICAQYGSSINSRLYLEKFFNLHFMLPNRNLHGSMQKKYISYLWKSLDIKSNNGIDTRTAMDTLQYFSEGMSLPLRTIEKIITYMVLVLSMSSLHSEITGIQIISLCIMRHVDREKYIKACEKTLTWQDMKRFIQVTGDVEDKKNIEEVILKHWHPYFDESVDSSQRQTLPRYLKGLDYVSHITSYIEQLPDFS